MKKTTILMSAALIILVFILVFWFDLAVKKISTDIKNEKNKYAVKIGQKVILEKDTLTIIDYSSIMETFTLSNGQQVNAWIVFNNDSLSGKK
jgi:hypothetical protein